jgi:site-specific DNA-methyltransferase (adenine-specific)
MMIDEIIMQTNTIYNEDSFVIMPAFPAKSVDLIYADPPFYTQRDFGHFNDTWDSIDTYIDYLRVRTQECHRLLKPTGSLYLHCDWHAEGNDG